jgi:hypothetical protein
MYDMYPWDVRADGPRTRPPAPREPRDDASVMAAAAVQEALDRRDNGGDAADSQEMTGQ